MISKKYFSTSLTLMLILFQLTTIRSQNKLMKIGDIWDYYDEGGLDNDWMNNTKNYTWKSGITPIGYGDDKINTEISFGNNPKDKHTIKYFKKNITISKAKYLSYEFRSLSDDGIVVYINGKELYRLNMPRSTINNKVLAIKTIKEEEEEEYKINIFDETIFNDGENIITTSVHQAYPESSDCIFSMELIGHKDERALPLSITSIENEIENKIINLNTKLDLTQLKEQNENLSNINYSLGILLFLIGIFLIVSLLGYYFIIENNRKKNNEIKERNLELSHQILAKEKEMITLATNLLHNKQYFKEIKADLRAIRTEDKAIIKSVNNQINYVLERDEDWEVLKKHFNAVHENFYDKLITKHSSISETELRHCLFIKLHLQTKEIARILLIDPRSVQTSRYRIKKKLNLNEEQDLRNYLIDL